MMSVMFMPELKHSFSCGVKRRLLEKDRLITQPKAMLKKDDDHNQARDEMAHRLTIALSERGIKARVARACDVTSQAVTGWEKTGKIDKNHLPIIELITGYSLGWLMTGVGPMNKNDIIAEPQPEYGPTVNEYRAAPVVGTAQMGADGYWYECDYPVGHGDGYIDVPTKDPNAYSLRVRGQSMAPAIRDGWLVVCEPGREPVPGEYVLVKTTDGRSMVKELLYSKVDGLSLMSVNDGFGRINLRWDEVDKIHPVSFIVPPSKLRL